MNAPSLIAHVIETLRGRADPKGPVAPVFWRGAPQDLALAQPEAEGRRIVCLWRSGERRDGGEPLWVAFERVSPDARRLFGIPLPPVARPAPASAFAEALEGSGRFRPVPGPAAGPRLLVPADDGKR